MQGAAWQVPEVYTTQRQIRPIAPLYEIQSYLSVLNSAKAPRQVGQSTQDTS